MIEQMIRDKLTEVKLLDSQLRREEIRKFLDWQTSSHREGDTFPIRIMSHPIKSKGNAFQIKPLTNAIS